MMLGMARDGLSGLRMMDKHWAMCFRTNYNSSISSKCWKTCQNEAVESYQKRV